MSKTDEPTGTPTATRTAIAANRNSRMMRSDEEQAELTARVMVAHKGTWNDLHSRSDGYVPELDQRQRGEGEPESRYQTPARTDAEILRKAYQR